MVKDVFAVFNHFGFESSFVHHHHHHSCSGSSKNQVARKAATVSSLTRLQRFAVCNPACYPESIKQMFEKKLTHTGNG